MYLWSKKCDSHLLASQSLAMDLSHADRFDYFDKIYSLNAAKVAYLKCHMHNYKIRTPPLYPAVFCLTHWHTYIYSHNRPNI